MLNFLSRKPKAESLYRTIVSRAREPYFYGSLGVPDTLDGRYEMILLHAVLIMRNMGNQKHNQILFDVMFRDMEKSLREIGIGDLSVPKHMKRMMNGFNGRVQAYHEGIETGTKLDEALRRNVYGTLDDVDNSVVQIMKHYVLEMDQFLAGVPAETLASASFTFPDMDMFSAQQKERGNA